MPDDSEAPSHAPTNARLDEPESKGFGWAGWLTATRKLAWAVVIGAVIVLASGPLASRWVPRGSVSKPISEETECYTDLVAAKSSGEACVHRDDRPIAPTTPDWRKPQVSVYSVPPPPPYLGTDPFRFDRVIVTHIDKGTNWELGDRMIWARVFVEPINFMFAGSTLNPSDYDVVVTKTEITDSHKESGNLGLAIPGLKGPKAELGGGAEQSIKKSFENTSRYEKFGVDITPNLLRILSESELEESAVSSTPVPVAIVSDPNVIRKQFPTDAVEHWAADSEDLLVLGTHFDRVASDQSSANMTAIDVLPQVPVPHCALRARVWMLYEERRVDGGRESYDESKHAVTLVHDAEDKQDVDIVTADEVSPAVWSLKICETPGCDADDGSAPLKARFGNAGQWRRVVFTDYGNAVKVAHWLETTPPGRSEAGYTFNYPGDVNDPNTPTRNLESLVPVKKAADECKPQQSKRVTNR